MVNSFPLATRLPILQYCSSSGFPLNDMLTICHSPASSGMGSVGKSRGGTDPFSADLVSAGAARLALLAGPRSSVWSASAPPPVVENFLGRASSDMRRHIRQESL